MAAAATAVVSSRCAGVAAEANDEVFETYTEDYQPLGRELRAVCHTQGIWHKAVYCFVFNGAGQLLIQRRSAKKKIGPLQWDLSVAEHLSPGETFNEGVVRGLQEELGVAEPCSIYGPLAPTHKRKLIIPEKGVYDFEFVESYRMDGYDGPISFNEEEVSQVKWITLREVKEEMHKNPDHFTVWFREELASLDYLGV